MSIKLITVDVDGIFLSDQRTYNHERSIAQYQQMKTQDTCFMVASGNQYYRLIFFFPEIANEIAFVVKNGGWVVSESKDVFNGELSKDTFAIVVKHLLTRPEVEIIAYGENGAYTLKKYDDAMKTAAGMCYHRSEYVGNPDSLEDIFFKFGLNLSDGLIPQAQKALHEIIGDIMVPIHIGNGSIDLIIPGIHKANGFRQLQKLWGIDDSEVMVPGDDGDNIEMLRQAGSGFAMGNTGSTIVAAAKYRAGSNSHGGILGVIDKILKHEAPFNQ